MLRATFLLTSLLVVSLLSGQEITILNPGFEDMPRHSQVPRFWINCGPPNESPPDILPEMTFQVSLPAYEGNTYLGLVTRDNDTWESVGAKLGGLLELGKCYKFSIALARSLSYYSVSREKNIPANFITPTRLRIWGGRGPCARDELLATSSVIAHKTWETYTFILAPEEGSYSHLILEVFYLENLLFPTNGNLLLDDASALVVLPDCGKEAYGVSDNTDFGKEILPTKMLVEKKAGDGTILLKLPSVDYFTGTDPLEIFLSNVLSDIEYNDAGALVEKDYQLEGETEVRKGYPATHALAYALNAYPGEEWELVVFDKDNVRQQQRVASLREAINDWLFSYIFDCQVRAYDPNLDDSTDWFCMSVGKGLYLVKR
jgi:hypothetical protein